MKVRFLKDVKTSRLTAGEEKIFDVKFDGTRIINKGQVLEVAADDGCFIIVRDEDNLAILQKDDSFEILTEKDEFILEICKKTGFDEITVGCFLSIYGMPQHICPHFLMDGVRIMRSAKC